MVNLSEMGNQVLPKHEKLDVTQNSVLIEEKNFDVRERRPHRLVKQKRHEDWSLGSH